MSDTTCPFDGDFCEKKQTRVDEWRERCLQNPQSYSVFIPRDKMFADCPIKHEEERKEICKRYRRYLFIVENVKKELTKQYEQR